MVGVVTGIQESIVSEMSRYIETNGALLCQIAQKNLIKSRDLELQLRLHLPRLIKEGNFPEKQIFSNELKRLALYIQSRQQPYAGWQKAPLNPISNPRNTQFMVISESEARIIHERFHYLSSFRRNSLHFGLRTFEQSRLMALVSISAFDLSHIAIYLPPEIAQEQVGVVSRVFCFDWAPKNTISYLLSQTLKELQSIRPEMQMFLTYVNPNMGFSGTSYKASNWVMFGREWNARYAYLDGFYVTDRQLISRFGTNDPATLKERLRDRFEVTNIPLEPLFLFAYFLDKKLAAQYEEFSYDFERR